MFILMNNTITVQLIIQLFISLTLMYIYKGLCLLPRLHTAATAIW